MVMADEIASRRVFVIDNGKPVEIIISIGRPYFLDDQKLYEIDVMFSNISKYNALIRGTDSLNALECAISYIGSIVKNSEEPKIFWNKEEAFK
jgi:hypothetical protein